MRQSWKSSASVLEMNFFLSPNLTPCPRVEGSSDVIPRVPTVAWRGGIVRSAMDPAVDDVKMPIATSTRRRLAPKVLARLVWGDVLTFDHYGTRHAKPLLANHSRSTIPPGSHRTSP